jgi:hypothetical protein
MRIINLECLDLAMQASMYEWSENLMVNNKSLSTKRSRLKSNSTSIWGVVC